MMMDVENLRTLGYVAGAILLFVGAIVFFRGVGRLLGGVGASTPGSPRSAPLLMTGLMLALFGGTVVATALFA